MRAMIRSTLTTTLLLLAAAACSGTEPRQQGAVETAITVQVMQPDTKTTSGRPAIDLEAPAEFQTATFALG